jgi:AcrR family transcriptional regulator
MRIPVVNESREQAVTDMLSQEERPQRADARRNRQRILESAREVFSEAGADAQIDDVAHRAGVGVGTVYRHFPTKEALLSELVREKFRLLSQAAREALMRSGEPFQILTDLLRENATKLGRDAAMQQALAGAGDQIWIHAAAEQQELVELTAELVARTHATGSIRADATAIDIGMLMCGLCATMAHPTRGFDWHRHLELIIDALRPR